MAYRVLIKPFKLYGGLKDAPPGGPKGTDAVKGLPSRLAKTIAIGKIINAAIANRGYSSVI
jgi:hypothetical protein